MQGRLYYDMISIKLDEASSSSCILTTEGTVAMQTSAVRVCFASFVIGTRGASTSTIGIRFIAVLYRVVACW